MVKEIGALARPEEIRFTDALPKTRSGKIMRRLLRDVAAGVESTGDTTTLEDLSVMARLRGRRMTRNELRPGSGVPGRPQLRKGLRAA